MKKLTNHELNQVNGGATAVEYGLWAAIAGSLLTPIIGESNTEKLVNWFLGLIS